MTKKQILRCIAFLLIVLIMLRMLCVLFDQSHGENAESSFHTYRELTEDTVDAVFIGTSGVACYWIAPLAYEEYGMTVYPLASDAMPSWLYINVMEEALTYQDPDLFILDIRPFTADAKDAEYMDAWARVVLESMEFFSVNRVRTAFKIMETIHSVHNNVPRWDVSYLLNYVKYHSMWSDDTFRFSEQMNSDVRRHPYGGFMLNYDFTGNVEEQKPHRYDDTVYEQLLPLHETALYEILEYAREKNLNLLFVDTPKVITSDTTMGRINRVYQILEEEGFPCVTYLSAEEDSGFSIDLDCKSDFFNADHVNYYGAEKFTRAFASSLDERYDLPDRRQETAVQMDWDGWYGNILEFMEDLEEYLANGGQTSSENIPIGE